MPDKNSKKTGGVISHLQTLLGKDREETPNMFAGLLEQVLQGGTPPAQQAQQALQAHDKEAPGDFSFEKEPLLEQARQNLQDREPFVYDPDGDALYRYYKDSYARQGRAAMENAMGLAQTMTGGYGNSYAQTAGQQAWQTELEKLGELLPRLYELAYEKYADQTDALQRQYQQLQQEKEAAYDAHLQELEDHEKTRQDLYEAYRDAQKDQSDRYTRLVALIKLGYTPTAGELTQAGMTQAMADAIRKGAK